MPHTICTVKQSWQKADSMCCFIFCLFQQRFKCKRIDDVQCFVWGRQCVYTQHYNKGQYVFKHKIGHLLVTESECYQVDNKKPSWLTQKMIGNSLPLVELPSCFLFWLASQFQLCLLVVYLLCLLVVYLLCLLVVYQLCHQLSLLFVHVSLSVIFINTLRVWGSLPHSLSTPCKG